MCPSKKNNLTKSAGHKIREDSKTIEKNHGNAIKRTDWENGCTLRKKKSTKEAWGGGIDYRPENGGFESVQLIAEKITSRQIKCESV